MEDKIMNIENNEAIDVVEEINTEYSGKGLLIAAGVALGAVAVITLCKKVIVPAVKKHKAKKEALASDSDIADEPIADEDEVEVDENA